MAGLARSGGRARAPESRPAEGSLAPHTRTQTHAHAHAHTNAHMRAQVSMEFWTNSNDECGAVCDAQRRFIKAFKAPAKALQVKVRAAGRWGAVAWAPA
jgi:hypothetical protein